jgi:hypothetical protein
LGTIGLIAGAVLLVLDGIRLLSVLIGEDARSRQWERHRVPQQR